MLVHWSSLPLWIKRLTFTTMLISGQHKWTVTYGSPYTASTERIPVNTRRDTAAYEHAHASRVRISKCKSTVCVCVRARAAESVFYTKAIKVQWYSCRSHCWHREHMRGMKIWILSMTLCRQRQPLMSKSNTHTRTHIERSQILKCNQTKQDAMYWGERTAPHRRERFMQTFSKRA